MAYKRRYNSLPGSGKMIVHLARDKSSLKQKSAFLALFAIDYNKRIKIYLEFVRVSGSGEL